MPRSSRSRSAPRSAPSQARGAHTAAAPAGAFSPAHAPPPPAAAAASKTQQKQPGMLAQMAATAGSVAVGSTIGHGLSHMLFGGRGEAAAPESQPVQQQQSQYQSGLSCDLPAKEFTKCLENGDVQSCSWYLEQLKACQAAAAPY